MDLFLKQGSGLGVIEACRSRAPHQRVVVLTNYATPDIRRRCQELGVDAVFDKSTDIDALIDFCVGLEGANAEALEMLGGELCVEQDKAAFDQPRHQMAQADLRGVAFA